MRPNRSTEAQRDLIRVYESVADMLPQTPVSAWEAWVRLGRQLKDNTLIYKTDLS